MKKFKVRVEYNPLSLNNGIEIRIEVNAESVNMAEAGVKHLITSLYIAGVDGLRVMDTEEVT